jgi:hypothetical protein
VDAEAAFIADFRARPAVPEGYSYARPATKTDAKLLKNGRAVCRTFDRYEPVEAVGILVARTLAQYDDEDGIIDSALTYLCPQHVGALTPLERVYASDDGFFEELALTNTFTLVLTGIDDQGRPRPDYSDINTLKDVVLYCRVLDGSEPWAFFRATDALSPPGATPSLDRYQGLLNVAHFYVCPDTRYTPENVFRQYVKRYIFGNESLG